MEGILESLCLQIDHELKSEGFVEKWSASLIYKIRCEVEKLGPLMVSIQKVLNDPKDADSVHKENMREWCHRVEDVLQRFAVEFAAVMTDRKSVLETWLMSWLGKLVGKDLNLVVEGKTLRKINKKVSDFEADIQILSQMFTSLKMEDANGQPPALPSCSYESVSSLQSFVGRQDDLWKLESRIYDLNPTICLWGERGLGKSALAWRFYNNVRIKMCFDAQAWVTLTKECPAEIVRLDILRQLGRGLSELENCLIVLDNVEGILQWEAIFYALSPHVGPQTKILLTTCSGKIAEHRQVGFSYKLEPLKVGEGWELLKKYAFPKEDAPDFGMFYELGKEMVQKCQLLPTNISIVGRNLSCKTTLDGWQTVNDNLYRYLSNDHQSVEFSRSFKGLSSKYHNLPYNLRQCFLYSSCFSRDKRSMTTEDLMLLWMGEGMVFSQDQKRKLPLIHTAQNYLWELDDKGMLQVELLHFSSREGIGCYFEERLNLCHFHVPYIDEKLNLCYLDKDVQEFSLNQRVKESYSLKVVDFCDDNLSKLDSLASLDVKARGLVIHFNTCGSFKKDEKLKAIENALEEMTQIQSLVFINYGSSNVDLHLTFDFAKLKMLRVVHFVRCTFDGKALPEGIDKLMKLRYLGLSHYNLMDLSIPKGKLRNLNVLNLGVYNNVVIKIQSALSQMTQLKHLRLPHMHPMRTDPPDQIVKLKLDMLTELETLIGFNSYIHDVRSLYKIQNLRHLVARAHSNNSVESIIQFIQSSGIQVLANLWIGKPCSFTSSRDLAVLTAVLMCHNLHELTMSNVGMDKFPDCGERFSSNITRLNLISCDLRVDPMEAIGKFPNLRKLNLQGTHYGAKMRVDKGGFQSLEHLELVHLPCLKTWEVNVGAIPRLSRLIIRKCWELEGIPDGLASISTLKIMNVELTRKTLSGGRKAHYHRIFSFVPSLVIKDEANAFLLADSAGVWFPRV